MSKQTRNAIESMRRLREALAEDVMSVSDVDILAEASEIDKNYSTSIDKLRIRIEESVNDGKKQKLLTAKEQYKRFKSRDTSWIKTFSANDLRKRLSSIIGHSSDLPGTLTLAYREGREMTDEDIVNLAEDLAELGFLNPEGNDK